MSRKYFIAVIAIIVLLSVSGCNLPTKQAQVELPPAQPPVELAQPVTAVPTEEPPPPPTAEPEIVHVVIPVHGRGKEQTIHDQLSQNTAPEKRAYGGDEYNKGRYERPFTAEEMEYFPFIDLVRTDLIRDEDGGWLYVSITVVDEPSMSGEQKVIYGVELDSDLDGRGDVLILADAPESTEWTTDGVQVWQDANANLGAKEPMKPDESAGGDGYEVLIFDEGKGDDADLAWVRLSPDLNVKIEMAFKLDLVDIGEEYYFFLWGAWAFVDEAHPDWFDHHDHFSLEEAGSPLKDNENYPLNAFFGADNTCRALSGLEPSSQLPGMCPIAVQQASGGDERCPAQECCPPKAAPCPKIWSYETCSCVSR